MVSCFLALSILSAYLSFYGRDILIMAKENEADAHLKRQHLIETAGRAVRFCARRYNDAE